MTRKLVGPAPATSPEAVTRGFVYANFVSMGLITAKGDLLAGDGASSLLNVAVGSDGQVLVADSSTFSGLSYRPANRYIGINAQTGTTYTPVLSDEGKLVTCTNASAITLTLPQNSDLAFPIGGSFDVAVLGAGLVTFVAGTGATAVATPSLIMRAQYSMATAVKISTNGWLVTGDMT